MTIPIVILLILIIPYLSAKTLSAYTEYKLNPRIAVVIGISLLFIFTGLGHFMKTAEMVEMLPAWVPKRLLLVHLTGLLEFALAAGFLIHQTRRVSAWLAILALILFFSANIYAAVNHLPMGGHVWGPIYLLIRAPLQAFIIFWIYWFAIKKA